MRGAPDHRRACADAPASRRAARRRVTAAAGCVLPAPDAAERARTEQLISRLTLAIADLATAHIAAPPALHHD